MSSSDQVVIVGGGVIGAMCAWYLSDAGFDITIVDREKFGAACSHGNCGYVSPSHILPLTKPGAVRMTLKELMKKNSAFSVKPRLSLKSLKWFWKFARRCNHQSMMESAVGLHELLQSSVELYRDVIQQEGIQCEWQEVGLLNVYDHQDEFESFEKTNDLLLEHFGVGAKPYDRDALLELEPTIKPIVAGAWYFECDCHMRPDLFMSEIGSRLRSRGVKIVEDFEVERIVRENGKARAIEGSGETIEANQFVVATGAMTPFLNKHLGCNIPIEPGKGYSLTMPTPAKMPKIPIIFESSHVAITPMKSKYRIGSTMEFVGYDKSIHPRRLNLLKESAKKYLLDPLCDPIEETWFGWRPMTWDGKPVIDRSPQMDNVLIAAGHNMIGLSTATGTGRLVKEMMVGETPHIDSSHFCLARLQK